MNFYPHHIGDYTKDTAHLSMLEDGAYRRMLDVYYATERPLPRDQQAIYRLVRARSGAERLAVDVVLGEFWTEAADGWRNTRADAEIERARLKSEKARGSAAQRWQAERNANASGPAMRSHSEGNAPNNQEPRTKSQKEEEPIAPSASLSAPTPHRNGHDLLEETIERIPLCDGTEYGVPKSLRDELDRLYPAVDPDQTLREIRGWCIANPRRRKTVRGVKGFITSWFSREQDKQSRRPS